MNINIFDDPSQVPQPRDHIRIEQLEAQVLPDRFRVRVSLRVTAFHERPNLILALRDSRGGVVHEMNVIGMMLATMEFTFHIRGVSDPTGDYTLDVEMFYDTRTPPQDRRTLILSIPPEATDEGQP